MIRRKNGPTLPTHWLFWWLLWTTWILILWVLILINDSHQLQSLFQLTTHWDAGWYLRLIQHGYTTPTDFAFFPLYPLLVAVIYYPLAAILPITQQSIPLIGGVVSWICTTVALHLLTDFRSRQMFNPASSKLTSTPLREIAPPSSCGHYFLFLAPASYVFLTLHTEGFFLFLTVLAFKYAGKTTWLLASLCAGAAALTRNHGVLVAAVIALANARQGSNPREQLQLAVKSTLVSSGLFALYPLYLWWKVQDPLAFIHAQSGWTHAHNLKEYFASLWLGNPWQNHSTGSWLHLLFFYGLIVTTARLFWERRWLPAFLAGSYVILMPLQGELVAIVRFATVLIPVWFYWGYWLEKFPRLVRIAVFVCLLLMNWQFARNFAIGRWAY